MGAGPFGQFLDYFLSGLFCADEQDAAAFGGGFAQKVGRFADLFCGLRKIDNVDPVSWPEDKLFHLGIPLVGAVSEMDSGFE